MSEFQSAAVNSPSQAAKIIRFSPFLVEDPRVNEVMNLTSLFQLLLCLSLAVLSTISLPLPKSPVSTQSHEPLELLSSPRTSIFDLQFLDGTVQPKPSKQKPKPEPAKQTKLDESPSVISNKPNAVESCIEIPNGLYKKPNPISRLWNTITGQREEETCVEVK